MKNFIEPNGAFILEIPDEWSNVNAFMDDPYKDLYSFELFDNSVGCFQISCKNISIGNIPNLISKSKLKIQSIGKDDLAFAERIIYADKFDVILWMAVVEDNFILSKYVYDKHKRGSEIINVEIAKSKSALSSFFVIDPRYRNEYLSSERFETFMISLLASTDLSNRAYKNSSSIEIVVLLANQIDALLRLCLILNEQIINKTNIINTELLFQAESDKPVMEKKVYKMALDNNIITDDIFNKLNDLYNMRNKVIHRYIITDIKTREVMKLSIDYSFMENVIGKIVVEFEQKQFIQKIGIYGTDVPPDKPLNEASKSKLLSSLKEKHAHLEINENISLK